MVNNHGDRFRPLNGVVGPLINGLFMAYKWRLLTTYDTWDAPPSKLSLHYRYSFPGRFFVQTPQRIQAEGGTMFMGT